MCKNELMEPENVTPSKPRVLLVEDDRESGLALSVMMERRGLSVQVELSAESAFQRFQDEPFHAILSDIRLTGKSGVELLRQVRETDEDFPFILITGYDSIDSAREAVRLGAQDYILKPLNTVDDVVEPLRKAIAAHRLLIRSRRLESELSDSEARLREVMENSLDILFRYSLARDAFDIMSPAASRVFGVHPSALKDMNWVSLLEAVHPGDRETLLAATVALRRREDAAGAKEDDGSRAMDLRVRDTSMVYRWLSVTCRRTLAANGDPATVVGVARDVTQEKERQELELALNERLERAERMQSVALLAGGVAHDLNNVLTPMLGIPEMVVMCLEEEPLDHGNVKELVGLIESAALQAKAIIRNLLTLSRRGNFQAVPTDVEATLRAFLASVACVGCREERPDVCLDVDVGTDLGGVLGSASHLVQLVTNLVLNAFEAIPLGRPGRVSLGAYTTRLDSPLAAYETVPPGDYVVITVADDGDGIPPRNLRHIFEPFYTSKPVGRSGSGLGLAVVYGVLQDHRGYVDVQSNQGKGTRFSIYLPRGEAPQHPVTRPGLAAGGTESILVVDDQVQQREIAARLLRRLGYQVQVLASGREMIDFFRIQAEKHAGVGSAELPVDLVLLDMVIEEGCDGLDAYREALVYAPGLPCVIVSGFSETDRVKEAMELGAGQYLQKPYTLSELASVVRSELDATKSAGH